MWQRLLFVLLSGSTTMISAWADLTLVGEGTSNSDSSPVTAHLAGGKMEFEAAKGTVILSPTEDRLIMVVPEQQSYMVFPLSGAARFSQQLGGFLAIMKESPPTVTRTGQKKVISGFACEQVLLKMKDGTRAELWVSPQGPELTEFQPAFQAFQPRSAKDSDSIWDTWLAANFVLKTFPLLSISYDATGTKQGQFLVKSVSKEAIAASVFAPPVGFREISLPSFAMNFLTPSPSDPASSEGLTPLQQFQQLQQQISQGGQAPTAEQLQKLQEISKQLQNQ